MSRRKIKIIVASLVTAAALIAGISVYGVTAVFAGSSANPIPTPSTAATSAGTASATTQELKPQILDMLENHMGLTGTQAEQLAATMAEQMQKSGITNASEMLKECGQAGGMMSGSNMMNGQNGADMMSGENGSDVMEGGSHESHHQSTTTSSVAS